jgi:hypothetical protein
VADGGIRGLAVGGLATVADGGIHGIAVGGLAVVADGPIVGIAGTLGALVSNERAVGLLAAGYRVRTPSATGLLVTGWLRTSRLDGVSIGGYNNVRGVQHGLTIGVFNSADELHGVQIGLLNRAKNNRPPFRWLPIVNLHFE